MIKNNNDRGIIKKIAEDIKDIKNTKDIEYINTMLETVYKMGVKEGKCLVARQVVDYIAK